MDATRAATQPASATARVPSLKETVAPANDPVGHEADRIADAVLQGRRWPLPGPSGWSAATDPGLPAPPPAATGASPLLVADDVNASPGQMRKGEFMAALRAGICAAVDAALAGTGRDSEGCPWIEHWLGYYETRDAVDIERALLRYAPEAAGVPSAAQYLRLITARVSQSAQRWARTGEVTGLPDEMPGAAGGGLLAGLGAMFFKPRSGGAHAADPVSVREQLGRGESLGGGLRARMEGAFGTRFSAVRLHTDGNAARLSNRLNARAFAIGPHIAFGGGEFQPGTPAGDALIAHELAHVVQQGQGGEAAASPAREAAVSGAPEAALEHDADAAAAGVAATLWDAGSVSGLHREARPRLRSGLSLQRCASKPKTAVPGAQGAPAKVKLTLLQERQQSLSGAGERLRDVSAWAAGQQKQQGVPDIRGVKELAPAEAARVAEAIELLGKASAPFSSQALDELGPQLDEIVAKTKAARSTSGPTGGDSLDQRLAADQTRLSLNRAIDASNEVDTRVTALSQTLDVAAIKEHTDAIATALAGLRNDTGAIDDAYDGIRKHVRSVKELVRDLKTRSSQLPPALGRILFVLRSFLALNAPGRVAAPTDDEIKAYLAGKQGNLGQDFNLVFGDGRETMGFDVFVLYASVLEQQLAVRAKMAAAQVKPASPVPTLGNAEDFFKALKGKGNDEVIDAYDSYAGAYFYHRVIDKFDDMKVSGVAELYTRPLSIFGLRPLVCTGFAMLGAHLLQQAGASLKAFHVAVRATDEAIVENRIDAGHALGHLTRKGKDLWVTNATVEASKADAERTVGWDPKDKTLREATGSTVPGANANLEKALGERGDAIRNRGSGGRRR
ncbi:eCIS core domain-containing protein [Roseateles chitinivorans]|uniref:eCIS core domain-containing protein n=1 Tax=Roseateles chitinivorans TaxID=2917965 RepID=UPI003D675ABE